MNSEQLKKSLEDILLWYTITTMNKTAEALDVSPTAATAIQLDQIIPQLEEELVELINANETVDTVETLDGVTDLLYVLFQAVFALESAGYGVGGALAKVCENNVLKFTTDAVEGQKRVDAINTKAGKEVVELAGATVEDKVYYFSRQLSNGKIVKPVDHPKVELTEFIPADSTKKEV